MNTAPAVRTTGANPITMMKIRYARSSAMARTPYFTALRYSPDGFQWHVQFVPMQAARASQGGEHQPERPLFLRRRVKGLLFGL